MRIPRSRWASAQAECHKTDEFWHPSERQGSSRRPETEEQSQIRGYALFALILALSMIFTLTPQAGDPPWYVATPLPARGEVTFYAPDVMERVYHRRLELAQVPYCDKPTCVGYIATLRPGDLGRKVWLAVPGKPVEGPFLVVDFASKSDFVRLGQRGLIAEVDNQTARRWRMSAPLQGVMMLSQPPPTRRIALPLVEVHGG